MNPNDDIRPSRPAMPPRREVQPDPPRRFAFPDSRPTQAPIPQPEQPAAPQPTAPPQPAAPPPPPAPVAPTLRPSRLPKLKLSKKMTAIVVAALTLLVIALIVVLVVVGGSHRTEKKLGADYIVAIQKSNYSQLGYLMYPPLKDVVNRLSARGGAKFTEADGYKTILNRSQQLEAAAEGTPKNAKITKISTGGGAKHIIITYKVGSQNATLIEVYDSSGKPHVLALVAGLQDVNDDEFKTVYDSVNHDINVANKLLDQPLESPTTPTPQQTQGASTNSSQSSLQP